MTGPDPVTVPDEVAEDWTLGRWVLELAERSGDATALRFPDGATSYAELAERVTGLAGAYEDLGLGPGDRIAMIAENRLELVCAFLASALVGTIAVPLNTFLRGEFLRHQLMDCAPAAVVVDAAGWAEVAAVADALDDVRHVIFLDQPPAEAIGTRSGHRFADLGNAGASAPIGADGASSPLSILYTSGTTGASKGCVIAHGYFLRQGMLAARWMDLEPSDTVMTASPLFHTMGQTTLGSALVGGRTAAYERSFSASTFWGRVRSWEVDCFLGVGAMAKALLALPAGPSEHDHPLRRAVAFPLAPADHEAFEARFGVRVLSEIYGQTECVPVSYRTVLEPDRVLGSAGRVADHLDVAVHDDAGRALPAGAVGEIVVRPRAPHSTFSGYWRRPADTVAAWRGLWHHTGDLGILDEDGTLWFRDRKSDSLRRRGENISSLELETALAGLDGVAEAAVHAVPSPLGEDDIKACLVLAPGIELTPEDFFARARPVLPYYALPRYVEVMASLPRNAMARVVKHELRSRGVTPETWDLDALGLVVARRDRRGS